MRAERRITGNDSSNFESQNSVQRVVQLHTVSNSVVGGTQLPGPGQRNRGIVFPRSRLYGYSMGQCPLNRILFLRYPLIGERTHQKLSRTSLLTHFLLCGDTPTHSARVCGLRGGRGRERPRSLFGGGETSFDVAHPSLTARQRMFRSSEATNLRDQDIIR